MIVRYFCACLFVCALNCAGARGSQNFFENSPFAADAPPPETAISLPPYPDNNTTWLAFTAGPQRDNRYFVDAHSISVNTDGSVRYTLRIESTSGVNNLSYEGLRCADYNQKFYAYGRPETQSWVDASTPTWRRVSASDAARSELARYLCPDHTPVATPKRAVENLKRG